MHSLLMMIIRGLAAQAARVQYLMPAIVEPVRATA